jgi:hypothetical protein
MQIACMAMSAYHGSQWATKFVMDKVERRFGLAMAQAYLGLVEALGEFREGPFPKGYVKPTTDAAGSQSDSGAGT